jgi:hypothetical protein
MFFKAFTAFFTFFGAFLVMSAAVVALSISGSAAVPVMAAENCFEHATAGRKRHEQAGER